MMLTTALIVAVVGWLVAAGAAWSSFEYFCQLKELREKYEKLKKEKALPPLYNNYPELDEPVSLGKISNKMYRSLRNNSTVDKVEIANKIINNEDCVRRFTLYLDTTEGCFVRTIDKAPVTLDTKGDFHLCIKWVPIECSVDLTIFEGVIVYDGVVLGRIADGRELHLCKGDLLLVDYTFKI